MSENKDYKLSKVVYFDEDSATDYVQIIQGGEMKQTMELLETTTDSGNTELNASASIGISKLFSQLVGFGARASLDSNLKMGFQDNNLIRNILLNTILTDFLSIVSDKHADNREKSSIKVLENFKISVVEDSLGFVIMLSPYLSMVKDEVNSVINKGSNLNSDIDFGEFENSIRMAKGYYEFIGENSADGEPSKIVLRFNIDTFKNNYRVSDLLMMDLMLFAIKVGKTTFEKISIEGAIIESLTTSGKNKTTVSPDYVEEVLDSEPSNKEVPDNEHLEMDVYDVILAGIKEI